MYVLTSKRVRLTQSCNPRDEGSREFQAQGADPDLRTTRPFLARGCDKELGRLIANMLLGIGVLFVIELADVPSERSYSFSLVLC